MSTVGYQVQTASDRPRLEPRLDEDEDVALRHGRYYTRIDELWMVQEESAAAAATPENPNLCRRSRAPIRVRQCKNVLVDPYSLTLEPVLTKKKRVERARVSYEPITPKPHIVAIEEEADAASEINYHDDDDDDKDQIIWGADLLGDPGLGDAGLAHFIPASASFAMTWWFVPLLMFGTEVAWTWNDVKMILNGFCNNNQQPGATRIAHTGIKHMTTNKARISGDRMYLDDNPCLLIVPVLTADEVRTWNGRGYRAIVLIDSWNEQLSNKLCLRVVARDTRMNEMSDMIPASNNEIDQAGALLRHVMLAIRQCFANNRPADMPDGFYDQEQLKRLKLRIPCASDSYSFRVPYQRKHDNPRVRVIEFAATDTVYSDEIGDEKVGNDNDGGAAAEAMPPPRRHLAPDPLLVTCRASLTFAWRHGHRFAAGAEPQQKDLMDTLAHEEFLESLQSALRPPKDPEELARALGQPGATYSAGTPVR